ncbi:MAG: hypothetical protein IIW36_00155 [Clostridia bacterium]|nr:hypothetical protein [Clostridia bacterium]
MKNKVILRAFLLLLAILMVIPFAGCENTPKPQETNPVTTPSTDPDTDPTGSTPTDTEPTDTDPQEGPNLPDMTFPGTEFTLLIRAEEDYLEDIYVKELDSKATSVQRAVYQRLSDITHTYGVLFDAVIETSTKTQVSTASKGGVDVFDLVVDHGRYMFTNAAGNNLYDWNDLPYVDLSAAWWSQEAAAEFSTPGGKLFTMLGDISYMSVGSAFCMFFNKSLVKDVGTLVEPYEHVYNKTWTFDVFEEYVTTLYSNMDGGDGTGTIETDIFGYGTCHWRGPVQLLYTTGTRVLEWKNGDWKFTVDSDLANEAVFDMRDLLFNSGAAILIMQDPYTNLKDAFVAQRVAFMDGQVNEAGYFAGSDTSYGVLPWPKYNKRVKEFYSAVDAGTSLFGVMRNTSDENAKRISIILEAMAYSGHKDILPLYFDTILSYQYLKDEDSIEMLHIIHDNLVLDFGYFYSQACDVFRLAVIQPDAGSLSHEMDEIEQAAREDLWAKWNILDEEPAE